jgi:hypothetical protein
MVSTHPPPTVHPAAVTERIIAELAPAHAVR